MEESNGASVGGERMQKELREGRINGERRKEEREEDQHMVLRGRG